MTRDIKWTESLAVGGQQFTENHLISLELKQTTDREKLLRRLCNKRENYFL